ncbi:MAG: CPBP family intramembrane metalloprotease [Phycisphaerales bacterium]|nr:CPBP family intramembrane metalloprotease [Phycisphaerales bacterium]
MPTKPHPTRAIIIAWVLGLAIPILVRYRGDWPAYKQLHIWLANQGVIDYLRNLDQLLIALIIVAMTALICARITRKSPSELLMVRTPRRRWWRMVLIASAPMLLGGLALGLSRGFVLLASDLVPKVFRAPILEELVFRGLLVAVPFVVLGTRRAFWRFAIAGSLAFGLLHVTWTIDGVVDGWMTILVTSAGGVWFAWIMREWRSVFVPMAMHATMNLGWLLAGSAGGAAGGGLLDNLLRAATIAIATIITIRAGGEPRK